MAIFEVLLTVVPLNIFISQNIPILRYLGHNTPRFKMRNNDGFWDILRWMTQQIHVSSMCQWKNYKD